MPIYSRLTTLLKTKVGINNTVLTWLALAIAVIVMMAVLSFCERREKKHELAAQASQSAASGKAINAAASKAVNTVAKRSDAENEIEAAAAVAQRELKNAQDPDAIRRAVTDALCVRPDRRGDPACVVRNPHP